MSSNIVINYYPNDNQDGFRSRLKSHFTSRLKNGWYAKDLKSAFIFNRQEKSHASSQLLVNYLARYFLGDRLSSKILFKINNRAEYCPDKYLYHFTPIESYNDLCQKGIISESGKVYLTSDPDSNFINEYFHWKVNNEKKDITFVSVKIDALSLSEKHKLYYGSTMTEVTTDKVEPEFLIL